MNSNDPHSLDGTQQSKEIYVSTQGLQSHYEFILHSKEGG